MEYKMDNQFNGSNFTGEMQAVTEIHAGAGANFSAV